MNKFTNSEIKENNNNKNNNLNLISHNRADSETSEKKEKTAAFNDKMEKENFASSKESQKSNYDMHKLRQKIQEQAIRLQKQEQYKFLCENRILQLDPAHPLPLQEIHLKKHLQESKASKIDDNNYNNNNLNNKKSEEKENLLQEEIYNLNQKLNILTEELKAAQSKNIFLEARIKNMYLSNSGYLSQGLSFNAKSGFPLHADKISNESLRENYNKIFIIYNDHLAEKNQILETLKIETINNEEQKNYIEILKQTIDSFVLKNGFSNALNQIKKSFYGNGTNNFQVPSNVDFLIEITQQRTEAEKCRKELVLNQALINELKREIDFLTKNNSNMASTKEKIIKNLETGIIELDQAKNRLKSIENENAYLKKEIEILKKKINNLQEEPTFSTEIPQKLQTEKDQLEKKYLEAKGHLENSQTMPNKIFDYKKSFDHIYIELNEALNQNKLLEAELLKGRNELENKIIENSKIKEELKLIDLERNNFLSEKDNCYKQISLLEKINKEIENCQKAKEQELNESRDKFDKLIRESNNHYNSEEKSRYEKLKREFNEYKINSEKSIEVLQNKLDENKEELMNSTKIKRAAYEKTKGDSSNANNDSKFVKEIEEENVFLKNRINLLEKDSNNKNELLHIIREKYDKLFLEFNQLESINKQLHEEKENLLQENIYWKKKYDSGLMKKITEIQGLHKDLDNHQKEIFDNQETINKLKK
jgi:hypothetical protein